MNERCPQCRVYVLESLRHGVLGCVSCGAEYDSATMETLEARVVGLDNPTQKPEAVIDMAAKAVPLNIGDGRWSAIGVFVSDKGKKARRIGKAFVNMEGNPPLSITIALDDLKAALKDGTVTENPYKVNEKYPDQVLDGKNVLRMAGFKFRSGGSSGSW